MPGKERRREKRVKIKECLLKCTRAGIMAFLKKPGGEALPVLNISVGGLEFLSREDLEAGQKLRVLLDAPAFHELLKLSCSVRWTKTVPDRGVFRVGVQFSKLASGTESKLRILSKDPLMRTLRRERQLLL